MTLTLNLFAALLTAFGLSIGLYLVGGRHEEGAFQALASAEAALETVRAPGARESARAEAARWERTLAPIGRVLSRRAGPPVERVLVRATALRIALARRLIPLGLFLLALGAVAGLLRRDRARDLVLYSSVTFSYIGKFLALGAVAFGLFVALCPFAPPLWTLYPASGLAAGGAAVYTGNLPPRL